MKSGRKWASTRTTKKANLEEACVVCGDGGHTDRIYFCRRFRGLAVPDKEAAVGKLGACRRCLGCHEDGYCRDYFLCRNRDCKKGSSADHHYFLCPKGEFKRGEERIGTSRQRKSRLTEERESFLSELSLGQAESCRLCKTEMNNEMIMEM